MASFSMIVPSWPLWV